MTTTPAPVAEASAAAPACSTTDVTITFDFEGASWARCVIEGPRSIALEIAPEHAPPINPSPWYAFRYRTGPGSHVTLTLRYLVAKHRYSPKLTTAGTSVELTSTTSADGRSARFELPPGEGTVSGQELFVGDRYDALLARLEALKSSERIELGRSLDGRPISAVRIGNPDAPRLIVLLGRQHPPEVTGALAMEAFLDEIALEIVGGRLETGRYQILAIPLLNPDGVARGHWRDNLGGVDLNRDWGMFTQPETRAVHQWLSALPEGVRPIAMLDFHSTTRNLFYVQGEAESNSQDKAFLAKWLSGREKAVPGYPFTIERSDTNPRLGTAKNWFRQTYAIPAFSYEVGDDTDRSAVAAAAQSLARRFVIALNETQR